MKIEKFKKYREGFSGPIENGEAERVVGLSADVWAEIDASAPDVPTVILIGTEYRQLGHLPGEVCAQHKSGYSRSVYGQDCHCSCLSEPGAGLSFMGLVDLPHKIILVPGGRRTYTLGTGDALDAVMRTGAQVIEIEEERNEKN